MKNKFQYLLFDWDGCLADTLPVWIKSYKKIFKLLGFSPTEKQIVKKVFGKWDGPKEIGITDIDAFTKLLIEDVNKKLPYVKLHEYASQLLQQLKKQNKTIVIITTSKRKSIEILLNKYNLMKYIDYYIGAEDVTKHKPDPEGINKILERFQADKKDTMIIGDSDKDIIAGKNANIATLLVLHELNKKYYNFSEFTALKPDYIVTNLKDILNIV